MSWYRLDLGAADLADADAEEVAASVEAAWRAAGCPPDFAAFGRHESDGRLHCHRVVYFSPAATDVARQLGARACHDPGPWDLSRLAGAKPESPSPTGTDERGA